MKRNWMILTLVFFVGSVGRAQVVLPSSSDYNDPYTYFRDCVSANSSDAEAICESQTSSLFPEEEPAQNDGVKEDLAAYSPLE
jgi:hypothetical protein